MDDERKVPLERVLMDMYDPDGGMVSAAARSYFYEHYATPEQRARMDREDKRYNIWGKVFVVAVVGLIIAAFIYAGFTGQL